MICMVVMELLPPPLVSPAHVRPSPQNVLCRTTTSLALALVLTVCSIAPTQSTLGIQSMDASVGVPVSRLAFFARKGVSVSLHAGDED